MDATHHCSECNLDFNDRHQKAFHDQKFHVEHGKVFYLGKVIHVRRVGKHFACPGNHRDPVTFTVLDSLKRHIQEQHAFPPTPMRSISPSELAVDDCFTGYKSESDESIRFGLSSSHEDPKELVPTQPAEDKGGDMNVTGNCIEPAMPLIREAQLVPTFDSGSGLLQTEYLKEIKLFINPALQLFICGLCQVALRCTDVEDHYECKHPIPGLNIELLRVISHQQQISHILPCFNRVTVEYIPGLRVFTAYSCISCGAMFETTPEVVQHRTTSHPSLPPKVLFPKCSVQRLQEDSSIFHVTNIPTQPSTVEPDSRPLLATETLELKALDALRTVLKNKDATWSCDEQREAVMAALSNTHDLIAILRTGSGKTMIAILPALMETDKYTICIIPLHSLLTDFRRRLEDMDVPYGVFGDGGFDKHNLILVSPELVVGEAWRTWLNLLPHNSGKTIARFVFDESHLPATSSDYRSCLRNCYNIRMVPAQMCLISGTISQITLNFLKREFEMGEDTIVLRMSCNRPELEYVWKETMPQEEIIKCVKDLTNSPHLALSKEDRTLVFVSSTNLGHLLAQKLNLPFYHGNQAAGIKDGLHHDWILGNPSTLICTTSFGAGNDYPHVRLIIHAGTPYEIVNYVQETSRGGRDGRSARCYMLPCFLPFVPASFNLSLDFSGKTAMINALKDSRGCVRFHLTTALDGEGVICHENMVNKQCNRCQALALFLKRHRVEPSVRPPDIALYGTQEYIAMLRGLLNKALPICLLCWVTNGNKVASHNIRTCPVISPNTAPYFHWRASIQYSGLGYKQTVCFRCHVPTFNNQLHRPLEKGKNNCDYDDKIAPLAYAIFHHDDIRPQAEYYFNRNWDDLSTFARWLGSNENQEHVTNSLSLFVWYMRSIFK